MSLWRTELTLNSMSLGFADINRGIFQGDSLSPLLFAVILIPLTMLLRSTKMGYKLFSGTAVSHLLYMDDLKLYGKNHKEIESLLHTVEIFSSDIQMSFGIRKCAYIGLKRGNVYSLQDIDLCNGESICSLALGSTYKYLGILEADVFQQSEMRNKVTKEYYRRVRLILKSELNSRNKFLSINAYAIPVIRYTVGLIKWPTSLLKAIDRQTRKLLTIYRAHHPQADVDRLCLPRKTGGRGLKSIEDVVMEELCNISGYLRKTNQPLLQEVKDFGLVPELEPRADFVSRQHLERVENYHSKPLHGYYPQACAELIDQKLNFLWLFKGFLTGETVKY